METLRAITTADEIIQLYRLHGAAEYAGERVTQLEHMVQAACLAAAQGYEEEVVLAAFLHDVGHICVTAQEQGTMDGWGIKDHEAAGAAFLEAKGFSRRLTWLVQSHVQAKRYLTWKHPHYYAQLSEASRHTLTYQGGPMDDAEGQAFEQHPDFELVIQMRYWDDEAKVEGLSATDLEPYRLMIIRHLALME
jgi:2-amino-1-hydroxyethylphosphonate dioxygenase (glycine-forming)